MTITVEIPDEFAGRIAGAGRDLARTVLEAIAVQGYRSEQLTEADIRQLLGFETRMEVHGFLKEQGVFPPYTVEDLEHDREVARQVAQRAQTERHPEPSGKHRTG